MNVLIIEDTPDIRRLLVRILSDEGIAVIQAATGPEALSFLSSGLCPDLVLLDIQMPDMDGWKTLQRMREDARVCDVPVVLCTVKGRPVDMVRGWELGCDAYVSKPFDVCELVGELRSVMARSPSERAEARDSSLAEARRVHRVAERGRAT